MITELKVEHLPQKSFYGKASVMYMKEVDAYYLYSYGTHVATAAADGRVTFIEYHSPTTQKHQAEFLMQYAKFKSVTKADIEMMQGMLQVALFVTAKEIESVGT